MNKVIVDKARLLRRVIVISWITLALCFLVKIFGGNFFEIMCKNPNYKALCTYIDSNLWFRIIVQFCSSLLCHILYILSILQKYKLSKKQFWFLSANILLSCVVKNISNIFGLLLDVWLFIIYPIILVGKNYKKYFEILIACFLSIIFQFISLIVKNLSIGIIDDSAFISLIFGIDVYIMCFLYYLYRNYKKESEKMGAYWGWFMGKPENSLESMIEKRKKKIEKNNAENAKLQKEIIAIEEELLKRKNEK